MLKQNPFGKTQPCNNCPYRKDVPLAFWSVVEFTRLIEKEKDYMCTTYGCHKNDGNLCVGWLMQQVKDNLPSIALRLCLIKHKVTNEFLQSLSCKSEMYASVIEMCRANYPEQFTDIN